MNRPKVITDSNPHFLVSHKTASSSAIQFCQGTGFDNVRHRLGLATRTQTSVCKSPFPSAGTAVSLFRAKTVQQRLTTVAEGGRNPVAGLWGRTLGDN